MKIQFISSEVFPFAKTGGLADVIGALPLALSKRGHKCSIILPFYRCVQKGSFSQKPVKKTIPINFNGKEEKFTLHFLKEGNVDVYFIENNTFFDRDYLYGTPQGDYPDNALRFGFFSRAVIQAISHHIGKQDILHCNDWQTGLIPLYIKLFHKEDEKFANTKVLFTIHNTAYQGLFEKSVMSELDIPEELFTFDKLEFWGKLSFIKSGLIYSNALSTVSEGYAREILTEEFGCGLDGLFRTRKENLFGIVNGVDYAIWDPESDEFIAKKYNKGNLRDKELCKKDLLKTLGMKYEPERPLCGMITRLAEQKGIDIISEAMDGMLRIGVDFVLLGFGDEKYNNIFKELASKHKDRVGVKIAFDNALAHKIEAGCDMFLMPSRYEPCGLNQLYSLKYATVPVVRAIGGLDDTVEDFDRLTRKGNGFKFKNATKKDLLGSLEKAVSVYKDKELWNTLLENGLSCDYSWDSSAEKYEELYKKI